MAKEAKEDLIRNCSVLCLQVPLSRIIFMSKIPPGSSNHAIIVPAYLAVLGCPSLFDNLIWKGPPACEVIVI
jgi:hypothetical protein